LNDLVVTNDTEAEDILKSVKPNIRDEKINIEFGNEDVEKFDKQKATEFKEGSIKGTIIISNGKDSNKIAINLIIERLPQTVNGAKENIEASLNDLVVTNDTEAEDILKSVKPNIRDEKINIEFGNEDVEKFDKQKATEFKEGNIKGTIIISNESEIIKLPIDLKIEKLGQGIYGAKENIETSLNKFIATNNTKAREILDLAKSSVINKDLSINFGIEENETFKIIRATEDFKGKITGIIIVSDGINSVKIPVNLVIEKLPQEIEAAKNLIENILTDILVNNDTTKEELEEKLQSLVKDNIKIQLEDFNKTNATESQEGKITGTIIILDKNINEKIELSMEININKLPKSSNGGSSNNEYLDNKSILTIGNNIKSVEELSSMLKKSDISILGISRDNLLSSITLEKDNTIIENNNIVFENVDSIVNKIDLPYKEVKATNGQSINGELSVLIADNNIIGMGIKGQEKYDENTDIKVTTKLPEDDLHIYTNVKDIDKYVEVKDKAEKINEGIVLKGINSDNYLVTTKRLTEDKQAVIGWNKDVSNDWSYIKDYDTSKGWVNDNGNWYFTDLENGKMKTGWVKSPYSNKWFYLNEKSNGTKGKMQTGWIKSNDDKWYYLNSDGSMAKDTYVNGYYLDGSGAWVK
ncbi:N-acetylmuramoyl-L-alanine amidase family protein, partial [Clostridium botulinum]|nr:N-acetylmuramoyl-L-alanine amidase family protein [Clostridium botulinum]